MERRLAAILAADVAGYSRLMEQNEVDTFERLRAHRKELFEPEIEKHHGRVFKLMGDGLLAEFGSVVDAVECAMVLQRGMAQRNAGLTHDQRISVRIGVNLGDVIVESDDRHGDGVNIAARLQQLAEPGAVVISGTAYDQVRNKLAVGFAHLGHQQVKNIAEPVRVYRVIMDPATAGNTIDVPKIATHFWRWPAIGAVALTLAVAAGATAWWRPWKPKVEPASIERMALPLPVKPSIAVLPFANMSDDPKQEYFADGMTDGLITELSQVSGLFVISRNSTFVYKGRAVPPKQVSEDLGVRYVLEGSVQRAGDRLRINAQLIDAVNGGHAWADHFDGSLADVFALQDKVTSSIADALAIRLTDQEQRSVAAPETTVPAAYEAFLHGWEHYRRTTPDDYAKAIPHFEEAIRLDPTYGRAYAALAMIYVRSGERRWTAGLGMTGAEAYARGQKYLAEAMKLPTALAHQVAGIVLLGNTEQSAPYLGNATPMAALAEFKEALSLDPGDSWNYMHIALALASMGRSA